MIPVVDVLHGSLYFHWIRLVLCTMWNDGRWSNICIGGLAYDRTAVVGWGYLLGEEVEPCCSTHAVFTKIMAP